VPALRSLASRVLRMSVMYSIDRFAGRLVRAFIAYMLGLFRRRCRPATSFDGNRPGPLRRLACDPAWTPSGRYLDVGACHVSSRCIRVILQEIGTPEELDSAPAPTGSVSPRPLIDRWCAGLRSGFDVAPGPAVFSITQHRLLAQTGSNESTGLSHACSSELHTPGPR